ncbi:MAG: Ig-like domain-containing protein [Chloroflexota bacterium]
MIKRCGIVLLMVVILLTNSETQFLARAASNQPPESSLDRHQRLNTQTTTTFRLVQNGRRQVDTPNTTFSVELYVSNAQNLGGFEFGLQYDPAQIAVTGISLTEALGDTTCTAQSQRCAFPLGGVETEAGQTHLGAYSYGSNAGLSGDHHLATIELQSLSVGGNQKLHLANVLAINTTADSLITPQTEDIVANVPISGGTILVYLPLIQKGSNGGTRQTQQAQTNQTQPFAKIQAASTTGINPDINSDRTVNIVDLQSIAAAWQKTDQDSDWQAALDLNNNNQIEPTDMSLAALRWQVSPTALVLSSPAHTENEVAIIRETILEFSGPLDPATINTDTITAHFAGSTLPFSLRLSTDRTRVTLFYDDPLPAGARIRVTVRGGLMADNDGYAIDAWNQNYYGSYNTIDFDTLSVSRVPETDLWGYVYDSYNTDQQGADIPIVGATIRVDGLPEANAVTDENGYFLLEDIPAPTFMVHIDGSTATSAPAGTKYATVGKTFHSIAGKSAQVFMDGEPFNLYLPPVADSDQVALSNSADTAITFGSAGLDELDDLFPDSDPGMWDQTVVTFPANSAIDDQGNPASMGAIIPVSTERLPAPLSPFGSHQLDIAVLAGDATTFDEPAPACFPNLPDPNTGETLKPGEKSALVSFNHDTGKWVVQGSMTVSANGLTVCTDPDVGIKAPGWHGPQPTNPTDSDPPSYPSPPPPRPPWNPPKCPPVCPPGQNPGNPPNSPSDPGPGPGPGDPSPGDSGDDPDDGAPEPPDTTEPPDPSDPPEQDEGLPPLDESDGPGPGLPENWDDIRDWIIEKGTENTGADPLGLVGPIVEAAENALGSLDIISEVLETVNNGEEITPEMLEEWQNQNQENLDALVDAFGAMVPVPDVADYETPTDYMEAIYGWIKTIAELYDYDMPDWPSLLRNSDLLNDDELHPNIIRLFETAEELLVVRAGRETVRDWLIISTGSQVWFEVSQPEYPQVYTILQTTMAAQGPNSEGGIDITATEEATILSLPRPTGISQTDVTNLIAYRNQTVSNMRNNIVTHGAAGNSNFADTAQLKSATENLHAYLVAEQAAGFDFIFERYHDVLKSLPDDFDAFIKLYYTPADHTLFVAIESKDTGIIQRVKTSPQGQLIDVLTPSQQQLQFAWFDPETFQIAYNWAYNDQTGRRVDLPLALFGTPDPTDQDNDGLPDEAEHVIGTLANKADTDEDGIPDGAEIIQGTDPLDGLPVELGVVTSADTPGTALDVCLENDLAAVADGEAGISVFDVSHRLNLTLISQVDTPGKAIAVACLGSAVIVADGDAGLAVIDLTDPPNAAILQQFGQSAIGGRAKAVATSGGLAYIGTDAGIVASIDPWSGIIIDRLAANAPIQDLAILGEYLYVFTEGELLTVKIVSGSLQNTASIPSPGSVNDGLERMRLFVGKDVAYPTYRSGFHTINISDPTTPSLIDEGQLANIFGMKQIVTNDAGLGLAAMSTAQGLNSVSDIWLYDISDPAVTDNFLTLLDTPGNAQAIALYKGLAYVADYENGLQVINYLSFDGAEQAPSLDFSIETDNGGVQAGSTIAIDVSATDDVQVRNVDLYVNGVWVASDGSYPFDFSMIAPLLNARGRRNSSVTIALQAHDTANNTTALTRTYNLLPDTTAPVVVNTTPEDGWLELDVSAINIRFDEAIESSRLNTSGITLTYFGDDHIEGTGDDVSEGIDSLFMPDSQSFTIFPSEVLTRGNYRVIVDPTLIADQAGNVMGSPISFWFSGVTTPQPNAVLWAAPTGGSWHLGSNWRGGQAPGNGDAVYIDRSGLDITVTLEQADAAIAELYSEEALILVNKALAITDTAIIAGPLTMENNTSHLVADGGDVTVANTLTFSKGQVIATNGGTIALPTVTSHTNGSDADNLFEATGANSVINLSNLVNLVGGTSIRKLQFQANAGGRINLRQLPAITEGAVTFEADGAGSVIDLSALVRFEEESFHRSALEGTDGGSILTPALQQTDAVFITIEANSQVDTSQLISYTNATIIIDNNILTTPNLRTFDGGSLIARNGGTFTLPSAVTSYVAGSTRDPAFKADGVGSQLDLSSLTNLVGGTSIHVLEVDAEAGGIVSLSNVGEIVTGAVQFTSDGTGSQILLNNLAHFREDAFIRSHIETDDGGQINIPVLARLDNVNLLLNGGNTLATAQIISYTNGVLTIDAVNANLPNLTFIDASSFIAQNGGSFTLPPAITSYVAGNARDPIFEADGLGSQLDFSSLANLVGGTSIHVLQVNALEGGTVNLDNVGELVNGAVQFTSDGAGSQILLDSLTHFREDVFIRSHIETDNGGQINIPVLARLDNVNLLLNSGNTLATTQIISYTNGVLTIDAFDANLPNLAFIDESSFVAQNGGTFTLPAAITTYDAGKTKSPKFEVTGNGSQLDFSSLTSIAGGGSVSTFSMEVTEGGVIDLSGVNTISSGVTQITADGTNSQINLSGLTSWLDDAFNKSILRAQSSGLIQLHAQSTSLTAVNVIVADGTIDVGALQLETDSELTGSGTIAANITNNGTVSPGTNDGATLTISGSYTQTAQGRLAIEVTSLSSSVTVDQLVISGPATLAGTLDLSVLNNQALPDVGDTFIAITFPTRTGTFDTINGADIDASRQLNVIYNATNVTLQTGTP